jgi:hypothetical protein
LILKALLHQISVQTKEIVKEIGKLANVILIQTFEEYTERKMLLLSTLSLWTNYKRIIVIHCGRKDYRIRSLEEASANKQQNLLSFCQIKIVRLD